MQYSKDNLRAVLAAGVIGATAVERLVTFTVQKALPPCRCSSIWK